MRRKKSTPNFKKILVVKSRELIDGRDPRTTKIYQGRYLWGRFGTFVRKCFTLEWTLASGCVPIAFVQNCIQSGEAFAFVYSVRLTGYIDQVRRGLRSLPALGANPFRS